MLRRRCQKNATRATRDGRFPRGASKLFAGAVTQHPGSIRSHAICTQHIQKYSQLIKIQKRRSTRTSLNQTGAGYCFVFKDPEHGFLIRLRQGRGPPGGAARCGWRVVDGAWSGCVEGEVLQVVLLSAGGASSDGAIEKNRNKQKFDFLGVCR